jgi:hypothetical protein
MTSEWVGKDMSKENSMNFQRITAAVAGAVMAALIPAGVAAADPDAPTPIGPETDIGQLAGPFESSTFDDQDFSVPDGTFEASVRTTDTPLGTDYLIGVDQDLTGNVTGEYNYFGVDGFGEVYDSLGGTPEAFYVTPMGDIDVPTSFVEAVGPSFFEPFGLADGPVPVADSLVDVPSLLDLGSLLP